MMTAVQVAMGGEIPSAYYESISETVEEGQALHAVYAAHNALSRSN